MLEPINVAYPQAQRLAVECRNLVLRSQHYHERIQLILCLREPNSIRAVMSSPDTILHAFTWLHFCSARRQFVYYHSLGVPPHSCPLGTPLVCG